MFEESRLLRLLYTVFLGILLAIFVGVGVNTFYAGPKAPDYPVSLNTYGKELTAEQAQLQRQFDQQQQTYEKAMKPYNRNVSMITLGAAVALLTVSLLFGHRIRIIADGIMFGGLFTLLYSLGRSFASQDSKYIFAVVSVALVLVLSLGYRRFVLPSRTKSA